MESNNIMLITKKNLTLVDTTIGDYQNCSNDYCISDADYLAMIEEHVFPNTLEWVVVAVYALTFITGVVGNSLVCVSVLKNQAMQTMTNIYIVNLAVSDVAVIVICLPLTLLVDVSETWFMGLAMCKITLFLMNVTVCVSVLTLCAIAVERWYYICHAPTTKSSESIRGVVVIAIIWFISGCIALPEIVVAKLFHAVPQQLTNLLTACKPGWEYKSQTIYQIFLIVALYLLPLWLMAFMYLQIATVLWKSNLGISNSNSDSKNPYNKQDDKLGLRRKVAIMLMTVVACFAICYLPVHLLNILRYAGVLYRLDGEVITNVALICHWLPYLNSTMNPIIYGVMSVQFRRQFKKTCSCLLGGFSDEDSELDEMEMNPYDALQDPLGVTDTQSITMKSAEMQDPRGVTDTQSITMKSAEMQDPLGVTDTQSITMKSAEMQDPLGVADTQTVTMKSAELQVV